MDIEERLTLMSADLDPIRFQNSTLQRIEPDISEKQSMSFKAKQTKGITTGIRLGTRDKLERAYSDLMKNNGGIAREISFLKEQELFEESINQEDYQSKFRNIFLNLRMLQDYSAIV